MVRRHGWQLPAHSLQVAAITLYFLLAIAYYIFIAPFLWLNGLVIAAYAVYSPLAFVVFVLYVRCTAIDPADPGVIISQKHRKQYVKDTPESLEIVPEPSGNGSSLHTSNPPSMAPSVKENEHKDVSMEEGEAQTHRSPRKCSCAGLCGLLFGWMLASDDCCRSSDSQQPEAENEILICTLCKAEVHKFSKHCRSCDKCVAGFDHHCRWLNNCIGKNNYKTFVALMSTTLTLLIVHGIVGTAVLVRCFVDRRNIEGQIMEKLGNGFTRAPFASVVAVCTGVALLACIPLGELFFFHLILIKKGITTYEYVVAMRAQPEGPLVEDEVTSSTSNSTVPDMSRTSSLELPIPRSLGLQQQGGWCTSPRIFVERQDEMIPPPVSGTTLHLEQPNISQKGKPENVRISAWRLAKLNKEQAARAAANARKASSVLRTVPNPVMKGLAVSDCSSSSNSSERSILSSELGIRLAPQRKAEDSKGFMSLSPYKSELPRIRTGREPDILASWEKNLGVDMKSSGSQILTDVASTGLDSSSKSSPTDRHAVSTVSQLPTVFNTEDPSGSRAVKVAHSNLSRPIGSTLSDGYDASAGETTDDMGQPRKGKKFFNRNTQLPFAGSKSGSSFGGRQVSRYRSESSPLRAIQFKGRGISTSVVSGHQIRRAPSLSPSSASDADLARREGDPFFTPNSSVGLHPAQRLASNSRQKRNSQTSGSISIFFSSPLMPIGESNKRQRSGIPENLRPSRGSRPNPPSDFRL
ncbi:protein S-acyltransferase 21 [Physcomitrium patens]|uniref:S-acyltransferase n=1 Tax=Physcomitrium patens TaxID=3218 RepID=A0A2K1KGL0_PHYPA|nr:probable protein S-acyltransferase 19 [Physcomitrium patens]XP_024378494.1 probable protein S-acyltransferase 19 [Physcomitrium patens]PNR52908.1 hypothetical protein PHYPA_009283 [Physcomitrium patens]|eukprot:XP_024378493.1 probable protein S-acyltransferase 19 [Physcomitrella patens]